MVLGHCPSVSIVAEDEYGGKIGKTSFESATIGALSFGCVKIFKISSSY